MNLFNSPPGGLKWKQSFDSPVSPKVHYNPDHPSLDSSSSFSFPQKTISSVRTRPTENPFIQKSKDLRSYIIKETQRLVNRDSSLYLNSNVRTELNHYNAAPNNEVRRRMMKMGLI